MFKIPAKSVFNNIFVRLLSTYILVILPVIFLGAYLYHWSYQNTSAEISRNAQLQLVNFMDNLNRELEWLEIQQYDLLQEAELQKMSLTWELMNDVKKKHSFNFLIGRLASIKNSSTYIKDAYVHMPSVDKTISAIQSVQDFDENQFLAMHESLSKKEGRLIKIGDSLFIGAEKFGSAMGTSPLFVVQIELDLESLREALQRISIYAESSAFLIDEISQFLLTDKWDESVEALISRYEQEPAISSKQSFFLMAQEQNYLLERVYSEELDLTVVAYVSEEEVKRPLNRFYEWAWLFGITAVLVSIIYAFSTYKLVHEPLLSLVQSFKKMERGILDIQITHKKNDEFGYLYDRFNLMVKKIQTLIDQDFKQKLMMQRSELKQLQSQINPHFLYNSFFVLNSLVKTNDSERLGQFTNMLGEYFQFITRNGEDNVTLLEEVRHSQMYIEIQKMRFSRRIKVHCDELPEEVEQLKVPRLILQPLIENAYEHSLEKKQDNGLLFVRFQMDGGAFLMIVEDNGEDLDDLQLIQLQERLVNPGNTYETTGLINIHRRLVLTYGQDSGLVLSRSPLNGLRVVLRISQTV